MSLCRDPDETDELDRDAAALRLDEHAFERLIGTVPLVGDHLHLNPAGYQALADAVPARWFRNRLAASTLER